MAMITGCDYCGVFNYDQLECVGCGAPLPFELHLLPVYADDKGREEWQKVLADDGSLREWAREMAGVVW